MLSIRTQRHAGSGISVRFLNTLPQNIIRSYKMATLGRIDSNVKALETKLNEFQVSRVSRDLRNFE